MNHVTVRVRNNKKILALGKAREGEGEMGASVGRGGRDKAGMRVEGQGWMGTKYWGIDNEAGKIGRGG